MSCPIRANFGEQYVETDGDNRGAHSLWEHGEAVCRLEFGIPGFSPAIIIDVIREHEEDVLLGQMSVH